MSEETSISMSGQYTARSEEIERVSSPIPSSFSSTMSSPRSTRKRTNDEMYAGKTGAGQSKNVTINTRPRTAPEQGQNAVSSSDHQSSPQKAINSAARSFGSFVTTLDTQTSKASTKTFNPDASRTFVAQLQELQSRLDREYDTYKQELESRDPKAPLDEFDWEDLEVRYLEDMKPAIGDEQEIHINIAKSYRNMLLWMQTSSDREAQRAIKRLRTRIASVQTSEEKFTRKEAHYQKVLKAFQSTMALLAGP